MGIPLVTSLDMDVGIDGYFMGIINLWIQWLNPFDMGDAINDP